MTPSLIGVGAGLLVALGTTRALGSLLYGVKATDPLTFIAVALILSAVALFATYVPATRAIRIDPVVALRDEV
jgi:ABC-type antimicrobial peptide transport system permease subunit